MSKEKRPETASGSARKSSRGASKRPTSPSQSSSKSPSKSASKSTSKKTSSLARKSREHKREDYSTQRQRKTEKAVRKASARASQRTASEKRTSQSKNASQQRRKTSSSTRSRGASMRAQGVSATNAQKPATRQRSSQGASVRRAQPVTKRKPTAAEIARRKRNRKLLFIALALLVFVILGLFTLYYVSNRIHDQSTVVLNDEQSSFAPVVCTPDIVDVSMNVDAPLQEDSPITFTITLHNTSNDHPCYIDVGRGHTDVKITSGEDSIVDLSTCEEAGKEYKQLLIDRNMRASFTLMWNRHRGRECSLEAATALPGMYKAIWSTKDDVALEAETIFEIKAPPAPEPEGSEGGEGVAGEAVPPAEPPAEESPATQ